MPDEKKTDDPSNTSAVYDAMLPEWDQVDTVLGGTQSMRAAKDTFLPQHSAEDEETYADRLASAILLNLTKKILESWVGKPFSSNAQMSKDMPDQVKKWGEDIDLQGNNMHVFLRRWFKGGLSHAYHHVMVEMPRRDLTEKPRTKADDIKEGVRPYWVPIHPRNVIFATGETIKGREVTTHLRILEVKITRVGFAEVHREQIRVYDAGVPLPEGGKSKTKVTLYQKVDEPKKNKDEWEQIDQWELGIDFIPLVTFYADRSAYMLGTSPLLDLSDLNIRHWQSYSDQIICLTVGRFPILAISGISDDDEELEIGPRKWITIPEPQGRAYFVEPQGTAMESGRKDYMDLEERMALYGVEQLKKRPGNITATGRILDNRESTSPLEDMAIRFNDAVNLALEYTAAWMNLTTAGTITINTEFALSKAEAEAFEALKEGRRNLDISRTKFLQELMRLGSLDDTFNLKENEAELAKEVDYFALRQQKLASTKSKEKD